MQSFRQGRPCIEAAGGSIYDSPTFSSEEPENFTSVPLTGGGRTSTIGGVAGEEKVEEARCVCENAVVLLGAGASFGMVPTANSMTGHVQQLLSERGFANEAPTLDAICTALKDSGQPTDIEYVANRVDDLVNRHRIEPFIETWRSLFSADSGEYSALKERLVQCVEEITLVTPEDIRSLEADAGKQHGLRGLFCPRAARDVVSLNYDNLVELLAPELDCRTFLMISYEGGRVQWVEAESGEYIEPDGRMNLPGAVRLYKIHGSATYRFYGQMGNDSSSGYHSRQFLMTSRNDPKYNFFDGFKSNEPDLQYEEGSIVFGGPKLGVIGRLLEVYIQGSRLISDISRRLVIVGYSFRDQHINELIRRWTGEVVICDPGDSAEWKATVKDLFPPPWGEGAYVGADLRHVDSVDQLKRALHSPMQELPAYAY